MNAVGRAAWSNNVRLARAVLGSTSPAKQFIEITGGRVKIKHHRDFDEEFRAIKAQRLEEERRALEASRGGGGHVRITLRGA